MAAVCTRGVVSSGADLATRAGAGSTLAQCAIVSGGSSAEVAADALSSLAEELAPLDGERSLELESDLLMVARAAPPLRFELSASATVSRSGTRPPGIRGGRKHPHRGIAVGPDAPQLLTRLIDEMINATGLPPAVKTRLIARLRTLTARFDAANAHQRGAVCLALKGFTTAVRLPAPHTGHRMDGRRQPDQSRTGLLNEPHPHSICRPGKLRGGRRRTELGWAGQT